MGTTVKYLTATGDWIVQPRTPDQAREQGWYPALKYNAFNVFDTFPYEEFRAWCEETFDYGTYTVFTGSAWFMNEPDAVLCQLRWA